MSKKVEDFIVETHNLYSVKYALTNERKRALRYKLAMADIKDVVLDADVPLAIDIILKDYGKSASTLRTASAFGVSGFPTRKTAGMCPRCGSGMQFTKLAEAQEARYCSNCHVCIEV